MRRKPIGERRPPFAPFDRLIVNSVNPILYIEVN